MKLRYYILITIFSLMFFTIALFPAGLAWNLVPKSVSQGLPLKVKEVGGTLWDGYIVGKTNSGPVRGQHVFSWDLSPLSLLMADLSTDLHAEGDDYKLKGTAHYGAFGKGFSDLNGSVDIALVNDLLKQFGAKASGELKIQDVTLEFGSGKTVNEANGEILWAGGPVTYKDGRRSKNIELPAVQGTLTQNEGAVQLSVVERKSKNKLGELSLKGTIGGVVVYNRVMRIAGMGNPEDEDEILIQLQRPIF
ncbi:MAG: type II secretion system protein N [Pseudomonadales bacterium]|nr:type II secretion system protein N [Pseudomonadales bacterium]